jgi:hypothetical protein
MLQKASTYRGTTLSNRNSRPRLSLRSPADGEALHATSLILP